MTSVHLPSREPKLRDISPTIIKNAFSLKRFKESIKNRNLRIPPTDPAKCINNVGFFKVPFRFLILAFILYFVCHVFDIF